MPLRLPCRRWEAGQVHPLWWPGVRPTDLSHATRESSVSRVILQRREAKSRGDHRPRRPQQRGEEVVEVDMALTRGADHTREDLLGPCAAGRPIPATDLAIDDGGADGVFSAPVGRVDVGGPQEGEHSRELAVEMPGEALGRRQSGRRVDEPAQAGKRPRAPARPCSVIAWASRRSRSARASVRTACTRAAHGLRGWSARSVRHRRNRCARQLWCSAPVKRR